MYEFKCVDCGKDQKVKSQKYYPGDICKQCKVGPDSVEYKSLYFKWFQIRQRCHDKGYKDYPSYGGRGIRMCDEWLNDKQAFYTWAKANGYDKDLDLDKDILSRELGIEPPIYSPETCQFVDQSTNAKATRKIVATNTTGYRGVSFNDRGYYVANIMNNNQAIHIKQSKYAIECAIAYDNYIIENQLLHTKNNISQKSINDFERFIQRVKDVKTLKANRATEIRTYNRKAKKEKREHDTIVDKLTASITSKENDIAIYQSN